MPQRKLVPTGDFEKKYYFFFFSPLLSEIKYERRFDKAYEDDFEMGMMYSPLYLLRREINKLCHSQVPYVKSLKYSFTPETSRYAALLLADIAISGIVFNITAKNAGKEITSSDFEAFYKDYLGSDNLTSFLMRCLRNSLQHNFFGTIYELNQSGARTFRTLVGKTRRRKIILRFVPIWDEESNIFGEPYWSGPHYAIQLNFAEYFRRLEHAFQKLQRSIKQDPALRKKFDQNTDVKNWPPGEIEP
jgi:hypothetical protein